MSRIIAVLVYLLSVALFFRLNAQDVESQMSNFNVGGGLTAPMNPTGRYFGVSGNAGTGMGANFNNPIRLKVISYGVVFRLASLLFIRSKAPRGVQIFTRLLGTIGLIWLRIRCLRNWRWWLVLA
jgi:hypothetical protein